MKTNVLAQLSLALSLAMASAASLSAAEFYYAQTTATQSYSTFIGPIPINGLSLTVPAASKDFNAAVITLNLPNLTLSNPTTKGGPLSAGLSIVAPASSAGPVVAGATIGCATCTNVPGTQVMTIVAKIPLSTASQPVEAEWVTNGTRTVTTQGFASISAILVRE